MIKLLGSPRQNCDGVTRRETLQAGGLAMLGGMFGLPGNLAAAAENARTSEGPSTRASRAVHTAPAISGCRCGSRLRASSGESQQLP